MLAAPFCPIFKRVDVILEELVVSTEGKTDCLDWNTDGWRGYQRVLPKEINHQVGKRKTQRLERANGILRQHIGRWHRLAFQVWQGLGADQSNSQVSRVILTGFGKTVG